MTPEELLYARSHEWVHLETDPSGEKIATIGISSFAVEALSDLVYMNLPEAGSTVRAGEPFGEVESVKAVSDLYSPVGGEVVEVNSALAENPERVSDDPYEAGWFVKIKVADDAGLADLMDYAAYQKRCAEED